MPLRNLRKKDGCLVSLGCHLTAPTFLLLDIALVFGLEADGWFFDDSGIVLLKALVAVFLLKAGDDISQDFVLAEQALILTAALDGGPSLNEDGHLLEDFAGPALINVLPSLQFEFECLSVEEKEGDESEYLLFIPKSILHFDEVLNGGR